MSLYTLSAPVGQPALHGQLAQQPDYPSEAFRVPQLLPPPAALFNRPSQLSLFQQRFRSWMHYEYKPTGKDQTALKNLMAQWNPSQESALRKKINAYLTDEDPFIESNGWALWVFEMKQNKYQVSPAAVPQKQNPNTDESQPSKFDELLSGAITK